MQVQVRNKLSTVTTFSDPVKGVYIEWGAAGDLSGKDIQGVPEEVVVSNAFSQMLTKGVYEVLDGTSVDLIEQSQAAKRAAFEAEKVRRSEAIITPLDDSRSRDYIEVECVGPGTRDGLTCRTKVPMPLKDGDTPPLCSSHVWMADQYIGDAYDWDAERGIPKKRWRHLEHLATTQPPIEEPA
jgi:hypothetical protein